MNFTIQRAVSVAGANLPAISYPTYNYQQRVWYIAGDVEPYLKAVFGNGISFSVQESSPHTGTCMYFVYRNQTMVGKLFLSGISTPGNTGIQSAWFIGHQVM